MHDTRGSRDRTVGARARCGVALVVGALGLAACAGSSESAEPRDAYAAVSGTEAETSESSQALADAQGEGLGAGLQPLAEDQIGQILLDEDEFPFEPRGFVEEQGTDYFHEHIGVVGESYTGSFGDDGCAAQLDSINERLVGDEPQNGVLREVAGDMNARQGKVYVWMLSYEDPVDTSMIWDDVLASCEGHTLESEADVIDLSAFSEQGFRGLALEMSVDVGDEVIDVDGFSASRDLGHGILMISAVHVDEGTFTEIVEAQAAKVEAHLNAQ